MLRRKSTCYFAGVSDTSAKPNIEFFWDVASPYTYFAETRLDALQARTGATIDYRPFLLGGVFKGAGNAMPAAVPAKGMYMADDLARWRAHYGVPFRVPIKEVTFPINSVLPMRVATAMKRRGQGSQTCKALMTRYWDKGEDVSEVAVIEGLLAELGVCAEEVLAEASSQAVKDELRANSDEAVKRGAFGAPTFFVGDQMFFGNDRLDFVEAAWRG